MNIITEATIQEMLAKQDLITSYRSISSGFNQELLTPEYISNMLQIPISLAFAVSSILQEKNNAKENALDSIPLFSLFQGLFLPLSGMTSSRIAQLFGFSWQKPTLSNREIVVLFLQKNLGLSISEKISLLMGDPFCGGVSHIAQDTLINILSSLRLTSPYKLRQTLPKIGDIGVLFIQECPLIKSNPPISCSEALTILRNLPKQRTNIKKNILQNLFLRCGKLERYFLVRLILRRLNFGYEYRTELISDALGQVYRIPGKLISNGIALSNIFEVAHILETEGISGLQKMVIKPLNPISPALAGTIEDSKRMKFPLWAECKYDGIRLMTHKETNAWNRNKYAAFTRRKHNWLDIVIGLEQSLKYIQAYSFILDGELHGSLMDIERLGQRPATVYEVYRYIQGNSQEVVRLKYIVFDILYLNGRDLTNLPFLQRRQFLERLLGPVIQQQLPIPISISEGFEVENYNELEKWYRYFCHQGHEGTIAKSFQAEYSLGIRTDDWLKKKADLHLDLVIVGAIWATSQRGPQIFSSYLLACRDSQEFSQNNQKNNKIKKTSSLRKATKNFQNVDIQQSNSFQEFRQIGSAQGLSQQNNFEIIQRITAEYLFTGKNLEVRTASGINQGVEILPNIVVTVRFEDIVKDSEGNYSLRDPKILYIRPQGDTSPAETDTYATIVELYLKKRLS